MRTNIELDDKLIKEAMLATGPSTKRAAVDAALRLAVRLHAQTGIKKFFGKVQWEGDLEQTRLSRFLPKTNDHCRLIRLDRLFEWHPQSADPMAQTRVG